jgi:extradiol dioxygenase family protein
MSLPYLIIRTENQDLLWVIKDMLRTNGMVEDEETSYAAERIAETMDFELFRDVEEEE